jgi:hypothetical protein
MIIQDLRTKEKTEHIIFEYKLEKQSNGIIPTGNTELTSSLGYKITLTRQEFTNIASYMIHIDKTIDEAQEAFEKSLELKDENPYD